MHAAIPCWHAERKLYGEGVMANAAFLHEFLIFCERCNIEKMHEDMRSCRAVGRDAEAS